MSTTEMNEYFTAFGSRNTQCTASSHETIQVPCECMICQRGEYKPKGAQKAAPYRGLEDVSTTKTMIGGLLCCQTWRKTSNQRRHIFDEFCPHLCPQDHFFMRLLTEDWEDKTSKWWHEVKYYRTSSLLPYRNHKRLCADSLFLLSAIHNRVHFHPSRFAALDARIFLAFWSFGGIPQKYHPGSMVLHEAEFGRWKTTDISATHAGLECSASKGLLILDAQTKLLIFLLGTSTQLLCDHLHPFHSDNLDLLGVHDDLKRLENELNENLKQVSKEQRHENWQALTNHVQNATAARSQNSMLSMITRHDAMPFQAPPEFNIEWLMEIATDRVYEAQDDLELLQTNPNFLLRRLRHMKKHNFGSIDGAKVPSGFDTWGDIINHGMFDPICKCTEWVEILQELKFVRNIRSQSVESLKPDCRLPERYDTALAALYQFTRDFQRDIRIELARRAALTPAMRPHIRSVNQASDHDTQSTAYLLQLKQSSYKAVAEDPMLFLIHGLCKREDNVFQTHLPETLYLLDKYLSLNSAKGIGRLYLYMYALLSDLAVLQENIIACELHRPRHKVLTTEEVGGLPRPWQQNFGARAAKGFKPFVDVNCSEASRLLQPVDKLAIRGFESEEKRLSQSETAYRALYAVWESLEKTVEKLCDIGEDSTMRRNMFRDAVKYYKYPKHLRAVEWQHTEMENAIKEKETLQELSALRLASSSQPEASHVVTETRTKQKTRPQNAAKDSEKEELMPTEAIEKQQIKNEGLYHLSTDKINIIDRIFPNSDYTSAQTSSPASWKDFTSCMTKLGFGVGGMGGSAHRFSGKITVQNKQGAPTKEQHSINIHRPHPDPELSPDKLQDIGKRLSKHFGWCRENFGDEEGKESKNAS